jgi:hypothetical protein
MRHGLLLPFAALVLGCTRDEPAPDRIVLNREPCFGACPVYRVAIERDGHVTLSSPTYGIDVRDSTYAIAPAHRQLSAQQTALVFQAFERAWSRWRPNRYVPGLRSCRFATTDQATLTIRREWAHRLDLMELYFGCDVRPKRIRELGREIDSIAGVRSWVLREATPRR